LSRGLFIFLRTMFLTRAYISAGFELLYSPSSQIRIFNKISLNWEGIIVGLP